MPGFWQTGIHVLHVASTQATAETTKIYCSCLILPLVSPGFCVVHVYHSGHIHKQDMSQPMRKTLQTHICKAYQQIYPSIPYTHACVAAFP